jgi:hypothetical protein
MNIQEYIFDAAGYSISGYIKSSTFQTVAGRHPIPENSAIKLSKNKPIPNV